MIPTICLLVCLLAICAYCWVMCADDCVVLRDELAAERSDAAIRNAAHDRDARLAGDMYLENQRLRQRLEISDEIPFDGIDARDATIASLEFDVERLREDIRSLRMMLARTRRNHLRRMGNVAVFRAVLQPSKPREDTMLIFAGRCFRAAWEAKP